MRTRLVVGLVASVFAFSLTAGCGQGVVGSDPNSVSIHTKYIYENPLRMARQECAKYGKAPKLINIQGNVNHYKCE